MPTPRRQASDLPSPPRQARSRATLERLLAAAEGLLEEQSFDAITVAGIVARARASVGSFYARFPSKEALLPPLYERYDRELRAWLAPQLAPDRWVGLDLPATADRTVRLLAGGMRSRQHLLRAVVLHARANPAAIGHDVRAGRAALLDAAARVFAPHRSAIRHDDWQQAVAFGLFAVAAVCRERILFADAPHAAATAMSDERLARELAHMLVAYLTQPAPGAPPA